MFEKAKNTATKAITLARIYKMQLTIAAIVLLAAIIGLANTVLVALSYGIYRYGRPRLGNCAERLWKTVAICIIDAVLCSMVTPAAITILRAIGFPPSAQYVAQSLCVSLVPLAIIYFVHIRARKRFKQAQACQQAEQYVTASVRVNEYAPTPLVVAEDVQSRRDVMKEAITSILAPQELAWHWATATTTRHLIVCGKDGSAKEGIIKISPEKGVSSVEVFEENGGCTVFSVPEATEA